jgi:hypothetical protein
MSHIHACRGIPDNTTHSLLVCKCTDICRSYLRRDISLVPGTGSHAFFIGVTFINKCFTSNLAHAHMCLHARMQSSLEAHLRERCDGLLFPSSRMQCQLSLHSCKSTHLECASLVKLPYELLDTYPLVVVLVANIQVLPPHPPHWLLVAVTYLKPTVSPSMLPSVVPRIPERNNARQAVDRFALQSRCGCWPTYTF